MRELVERQQLRQNEIYDQVLDIVLFYQKQYNDHSLFADSQATLFGLQRLKRSTIVAIVAYNTKKSIASVSKMLSVYHTLALVAEDLGIDFIYSEKGNTRIEFNSKETV
jgi:hypothetical protein